MRNTVQRYVFMGWKWLQVGEDFGCTTPSSSDKTAIKTYEKKNATLIYVKDHKEM